MNTILYKVMNNNEDKKFPNLRQTKTQHNINYVAFFCLNVSIKWLRF